MHNSTLLIHFQLLRPEQIVEFKEYISTPFFNKSSYREEVKNLGWHILQYYPDFDHENLEKEACFRLLYPEGAKFDLNRFKKVMSELNNLLRDYLLWANYNTSEKTFQRNLDWTEMMRKSDGDIRKYELALEKIKNDHEQELESPQKYFHRYLIELEEMEWRSLHNNLKDDINLGNVLESLYRFFAVQGLSLTNHLIVQKSMAPAIFPEIIYQEIRSAVEMVDNDNLSFQTISRINEMLVSKNMEAAKLNEFFQHLKANEHLFQPELLRDYYTYLRNVCASLLNTKPTQQVRELLFEIYKENVPLGYLYVNKKIQPNTMMSITRNGLTCDALDWVKEFIESHRGRIHSETEEQEYYRINFAEYYFWIGEYQMALDILPQTQVKNITYLLTMKLIEIKCYYELQSDILPYKLEAFKVYVSRNAGKVLSEYQQQMSQKFINILSQILPKSNKESINFGKIKAKVTEESDFTLPFESIWLLEKIAALEQASARHNSL